MGNEEDAVRGRAHAGHGSAVEDVHGEGGQGAAEDDELAHAANPDALCEEEVVVEQQVDKDEGVDDAAQDAVVAVHVLVGGAQGPGEGVESLEGEKVLDGHLGEGDDAEALGQVEVVWQRLSARCSRLPAARRRGRGGNVTCTRAQHRQ